MRDIAGIGSAVTWPAETPVRQHEYVAQDLRRGLFVNAHEFVVGDDAFGKEWFVIHNGTITDYYFVRHSRQNPHGNIAGKSHFILSQVPRETKIDRLLPYPAEDE